MNPYWRSDVFSLTARRWFDKPPPLFCSASEANTVLSTCSPAELGTGRPWCWLWRRGTRHSCSRTSTHRSGCRCQTLCEATIREFGVKRWEKVQKWGSCLQTWALEVVWQVFKRVVLDFPTRTTLRPALRLEEAELEFSYFGVRGDEVPFSLSAKELMVSKRLGCDGVSLLWRCETQKWPINYRFGFEWRRWTSLSAPRNLLLVWLLFVLPAVGGPAVASLSLLDQLRRSLCLGFQGG